MENDLSKELSKAITDAISSVLKARDIPQAVVQARITVDGSDWMPFAASVSGTEPLGGGGGSGGIASGVTGASGGKPD